MEEVWCVRGGVGLPGLDFAIFPCRFEKSAFLPPVSKPSEIRTPGKVLEVRLVKGFDIVWEVAAAGTAGTLTLAKI